MSPRNPGTSGPRLPLVEEPDDPVAAGLFDTIRSRAGRILNLHRMMAHAPALMQASYDTAMAMRHGMALPRPLVELMILRTAQLLNSDYEWQQHLPMALAHGLTQQKVDALAGWRTSPLFSDAEGAALLFCEAIVNGTEPEAADFSRLRRHYSSREIVELALLVSHYLGAAHFIRALGIPLEKPAGKA